MKTKLRVFLTCLVVAALSACGGSSSSGSSPPGVIPPPSAGAVTLEWTPPTTNNDGSTLVDLAGYKIYQSQTNSYAALQLVTTLTNPGLASYMVEGLAAGTYYFSVTAYNSSNSESDYSNLISMTVN